MRCKPARTSPHGFALFVVILLLAGIGVLAAAAIIFTSKVNNLQQEKEAIRSMYALQGAARAYYRGHEDLPAVPAGGKVPLGTAAFNLTSDHGTDVWGQNIIYQRASGTRLDIRGVTVDGKAVAGYFLSFGPNQKLDSTLGAATAVRGGDDILLPINVQAEAVEIAVEELTVLARKVCAACRAGRSSITSDLNALRAYFLLGEQYQQDPWGRDYLWDAVGKTYYSEGPSTATADDNLSGPSQIVCCSSAPFSFHEPFDDPNLANWNQAALTNLPIGLGGSPHTENFAGSPALVPGGLYWTGFGLWGSLLTLDWERAAVPLDTAWSTAGHLLSYDAQVKVAKTDSIFNAMCAGLSFRLDDRSSGYGLSFMRPNTWNSDGIPNGLVPQIGKLMAVLWQQERTGTNSYDYRWLAYKELDGPEPLDDDFETDQGWTTTSDNPSEWNKITSDYYSATHCWRADGGSNGNWKTATLVSPAIDLSGVSDAVLTFRHKHDLRTKWAGGGLRGARGYVEISTNGGSSWSNLLTYNNEQQSTWDSQSVDISSYAGNSNVRLRFRFYVRHNSAFWQVDDVRIASSFPLQMATLMVRVHEAITVPFAGGETEIRDGDTVTQDNGATGVVYGPPLLTGGSWAVGSARGLLRLTNVGGTFADNEDLKVNGAKAAEQDGDSRKDNYIQAYHSALAGYGTPGANPLDYDKHGNPRGEVHWPPDDVNDTAADNDYFTLIQWQAVDSSVELLGSGKELNSIIRTDKFTSPDSGAFGLPENPEIGLHTMGGITHTIRFDDFAMQSQPGP